MDFEGDNRLKAIIITGAPTTGKTTLSLELQRKYGLPLARDYTSRPPRPGESEANLRHFVSTQKFKELFYNGCFYEPSLSFAEYGGHYYGTPREWATDIQNGASLVAVVTSTEMAMLIKADVGPRVVWTHLVANTAAREERLASRGISPAEIKYRLDLSTGDSAWTPANVDLEIDTSSMDIQSSLGILYHALCHK